MSVFSALSPCESLQIPITLYNTGTLYDYLVGDAVRGYDGKWYIRGGLGTFITGCAGRNGTFKSTLMDGLIARVMQYYPGIETLIHDSEGSKDIQRVIACGGTPCAGIDPNRITLISSTNSDVQSLWKQVSEIGAHKEANKDQYLVETPFVDPMTGKRIMSWIPTVVFVDSLSELESLDERTMLADKDGLNDKKIKTVWMVDGNKKTLLIRHLRKACEAWGMIVVCTAHVGDNIAMDSYMPPAKQFQHLRQADHLKGVGSKFGFLARILVATRCSLLQSTDKDEVLYGDTTRVPPKDLNEVTIGVVRTKNNLSGGEVPFVISQSRGLLNDITNYHYLRSNDYYGLVGNKVTHACAWTPDAKMTRNTASAVSSKSYENARALELCAQLCFIRNNWSIASRFPAVMTTPEELYTKLQTTSPKIDEILASTGVWQYQRTKDSRSYMSILDVLDLLSK